MTVIGAVGALRSRALFPGETGVPDRGAIAGSLPDVRGKVVRRQDDDYELWRQSMVWHTWKPDRYPDLIVQARTDEDVVAVVRYAARNKLKIAVRSGGHNPLAPSVRDGGICLDLSPLTDIRVDAGRQIASIQTGVRSLQLISALAPHGLCFPTPHCASVGMGGFLLGGGLGWNHPYRGGVATFNIDAAELVTADGRHIKASAAENPDFLWAVRGGGPGLFAVVTRMDLKLYPAPKAILVSSYILPLERLETVTSVLGRISEQTDRRLEILAALMHDPSAAADAAPEQSKICFLTAFAFGDAPGDARAMLEPLARSPVAAQALVKEEARPFTFKELYPEFFGTDKPGGYLGRYACDSAITEEPGEILHALADHFRRAPSPICHVIASYGLNLEARDDACFSSIARHYVGCFAIWDDAADDARGFGWLEQAIPRMDRFAKGHYVNEVEVRLHPDRIRHCYSDAAWKRLQALRRQHDPQGVFHTYLGQT
jgi:FAD/FMN-containing dehydrogenase